MNDTGNLNLPLVNNVLSRFTHQNQNSNVQNIVYKPKEDSLIKEFSNELKVQEGTIKNFENLSKELILMGFQPKNVLHSFLVYKYKTSEEGIEILTKSSEGLWNHRYIDSDENKCFVCGDIEHEHRDLKRISLSKQNSAKINIPNINIESILERRKTIEKNSLNVGEKIDSGIYCKICFSEIIESDNENIFHLLCMHKFCKECITEYLKEEIKNSRVQKIICPETKCEEVFEENIIKSLTDEELFYKYKKFLQRAKIKDDVNLTICPILDCEGFANINTGDNDVILEINNQLIAENNHNPNEDDLEIKLISGKRLICNKGHSFCSNCNQAWHGDASCDADKEIKSFATYSGIIVKKCPQCNVWTEKNDGCNHMACKICSNNWCWLCEKECLPDHYFTEGTPCYGKQFNEQSNPDDLEMNVMIQSNSFASNFLMCYLLSFMVINMATNTAFRNNNNNQINRPPPSKIAMYISLSCLFLIGFILMLLFNGYVGLTMLFNLRHLNGIRNICAKLTIVLVFISIYLLFYLFGGPLLSAVWFIVTNFYLIIKLIRA